VVLVREHSGSQMTKVLPTPQFGVEGMVLGAAWCGVGGARVLGRIRLCKDGRHHIVLPLAGL
jgi:hypothetical protein